MLIIYPHLIITHVYEDTVHSLKSLISQRHYFMFLNMFGG